MNDGTFANEGPAGVSPDPAATYTTESSMDNPGKRLVLAGIGAFATACDVAGQTFDRFVERGSEAQEDAFRRLDDARLANASRRTRFNDVVRSAMNTFLDGVNVPSKADMDIINTKLNIVSRKLDDLQMQSVGATPTPSSPTSVENSVPPIAPDDPAAD